MPRVRYKPRLKKGIVDNQKIIPIKKKESSLKKVKWNFFRFGARKRFSFLRNDTLILFNHVLDQRKRYKFGNITKQKFFSFFSTLRNKHFFIYYSKKRKHFDRKAFFFYVLERRLDFMLLKINFAKTAFQARWLTSKGFVLVNNRRCISSSYILKKGDVVRLLFSQGLLQEDIPLQFISLSHTFLEICYETSSFVVLQPIKVAKFGVVLYPHFFNFEELVNFYRA